MAIRGWLGGAVVVGIVGCQPAPQQLEPQEDGRVLLGVISGYVDAHGTHHMSFEPTVEGAALGGREGVRTEELSNLPFMGGGGRGANPANSVELAPCAGTLIPTCDTPYGPGTWVEQGVSMDPAICGALPAGRTHCYRTDVEVRPFFGREVTNLYVEFRQFRNGAGTADYDILPYGGAAPTLGLGSTAVGTVLRYGTTEPPGPTIDFANPPHQASLRSWLWSYPAGATDFTFRYTAQVWGSDAPAGVHVPYQVSVTQSGDPTAEPATQGCTTSNGHFTVLASEAALLPGHPAGTTQIYQVRRLTGAVALISSAAAGGFSNGDASNPCITPDGAHIVFESDASDLVAATPDDNGVSDIFVHDVAAGTTSVVSSSAGALGTDCGRGGGSTHAAISDDGRYVAFSSTCASLCGGNDEATGCYVGRRQVYRFDTDTSTLVGVSVRGDGAIGADTRFGGAGTVGSAGTQNSHLGWISADGNRIAFSSTAAGEGFLAPDATDTGTRDVFVRVVDANTTTRISDGRARARNPHISADGMWVAFETDSPAVGGTDANGASDIVRCASAGGSCAYVSVVGGATAMGASARPWLSRDGALVAFESAATDLVAGDMNEHVDVFVRDLGAGTTTVHSNNVLNQLGDGPSTHPRLDPTGAYVMFESAATDLEEDNMQTFDGADGDAADVYLIRR